MPKTDVQQWFEWRVNKGEQKIQTLKDDLLSLIYKTFTKQKCWQSQMLLRGGRFLFGPKYTYSPKKVSMNQNCLSLKTFLLLSANVCI